MRNAVKYYVLLILIYVGIFWSFIQYSITGLFSYWDELYAILFVPIFIYSVFKKNISKLDTLLFVLIITFSVLGLIGNLINSYATFEWALSDLFLNIKFFMCCYLTLCIFNTFDIEKYRIRIKRHINALSYLFLLLFVLNRILNIFPIYEIRFGVSSEQLIFAHPTFCASAIFYLILLRVLFIHAHSQSNSIWVTLLLCIIVLFTLRFKAIATIMLFIAIYIYIYNPYIKQLKWLIVFLGVGAIFLLSYDQITAYFTGYGLENFPRGVLLLTSIKMLIDYFPFGAGFATFGSYMSGVHYSPVYYKYGISEVYGITKENYNAMTDQYWPMIAGQTGIVGLICMVCIWVILYIKINKIKPINKIYFVVAISCLVYILVSSTSESAICNPACMPFAIILGLIFAQEKRYLKNDYKIEENL